MPMNTRGQALLNAYLNRYVNANQSTVNSGRSNASSAAQSGTSRMNALDIDIPALKDYTNEVYAGILENGQEQLDAAKAAEEARLAAEEAARQAAAKQAARNSARSSGRRSSKSSSSKSSGGSSDENSSGSESTDTATEFDLDSLFSGNSGNSNARTSSNRVTLDPELVAKSTRRPGSQPISESNADTDTANESTNSDWLKDAVTSIAPLFVDLPDNWDGSTNPMLRDGRNVIEEAWYRAQQNQEGIRQSILGSFAALGDVIAQAVRDTGARNTSEENRALNQAQARLDELVSRGNTFTLDENGVAHPTQEYLDAVAARDAAKAALDNAQPGTVLTEDNSTGVRMINEAQQNFNEAMEGIGPVPRFVGETANSLVTSAPGYALSAIPYVGPVLGTAYIGAQATGNRAAELSNAGVSAGDALSRGLVSGGIEMATEKLPIDNWLGILNNAGTRSAVRDVLSQMGSEASEEAVSYIANYLADEAFQDPNAEFSLAELAQNALGGALGGGIMGGLGAAAGRLMNGRGSTTQNMAEPQQQNQDIPDLQDYSVNQDILLNPQTDQYTTSNAEINLPTDSDVYLNAIDAQAAPGYDGSRTGGIGNGTETNPDLGRNVSENFEIGNPGGTGAEYQPAIPGGTAVAENGGARGSSAQEAVNYAQIAQNVTGRDRRSTYTRRLQSLYENMANGTATNVDAELDDIARGLVRESDYTVDADPSQQQLRDYLRNTRIYVNQGDASEILNATGLRSISQYNIQNGLNLTTNPDGAVPLDTAMQELAGMNVGYSGDGTSPVDDLMQIAPRTQPVVDSDLMQADIDYTKEIMLDNFSGRETPTFEDWLRQNNVSNEWGDAPDYIRRVADRYGIEHRVESYDDDFGFDSLPEVNPQGESLSRGIDQLWDGTSGTRPAQSVGADMLRNYYRAEVPNLDTGVQRWVAGILPEQERQGLGLGEQTHEAYSFREAADTGRSDVDVAVQQNNGDELAAIDQLSNELANKKQWDATDTATAQDMSRRLQNQMLMADPNSTEYGQIKERLKLLYERSSQAASRQGRALAQNRAAEFTEQTPFQKFQQVSDQIAKSWENSHKRDAQNVRNLANDIVDAGQEIPGPQDAEFDNFLRSEGITPTNDSVEDHLNAARKIVQDLADAHRVNLTDDQVNDAAQRLLAGGDKNDVYNRLLADIAGIEELQGQDFEDVVAIAEQMKDMPDSRERYQLETKMYAIMGRLLPARSWFERLNNIRYLAMLGNPRTHVRNITGNILMRGLTGMTESVSAVIQNALPQDQRTRAILTPADRSLVQAARDYAYNQAYSRVFRGRDTIRNPDGTTQNVGDRFNVRFGIENARQTYGNSPVGRALEAASNANSGFMTRVDDWFRASEFSSSLAQQLKAQGLDASALTSTDAGIQNRVDQMVDRAIADADEATFQTDNWISTALSRSSNTLRNGNLSQKLLYMVEEGLLPFKRTPTNIVKTALEYNPLGATVEAIYRATHGRSAADVIDSASKGVTGTALIAIGYALASAGLLNGSGSDEEDENNFNTMQGQQAYSINIPGVGSYTIDWASPAAVPLLLGAELPDILGGDYDAGRIVDALRNMAQPVLEMTMLSGLNDTLDNLRYLDDNQSPLEAALSSAASGYFGQFYPTVLGQIARTVDDTRRDTYGGGDSRSERDLTYNIQSLENRIPGLSTTNEPWLDAWGRPQENVGGNVLGRAAYNMLSPGYFAAENTTPVDSYLDELYDATGDTGVLPTRASSYVTVDGTRTYLTPEQRTEYAFARGQTAYNIIDELMGNDAFTAMSDSDQAEAIKDVYSLANKIGTAAAVPDYTSDDKLYGVYLEDGIDGVVNYALADAAVSSAKDAAGEDASFGNAETWNAMQDLGLDDVSLVDTYLAKASDSVSERIDELVGPEGVIAYRNAYDGADRDGNGSVSKTELAIALSNSGASDDVAFRTYMATQTTTSDDGEQSTDEKAASAYQQFGASGGMNWLRYYSAYSIAKEQEQARAKAAGESADLKGLAESLLNQMGLSNDQKRAFFSLTNSSWKNNPF